MHRRARLVLAVSSIFIVLAGWTPAWSASADAAALQSMSDGFVAISEKVMPSVVTIYAEKVVTREIPSFPFFFDMFPDWFGQQGSPFGPRQPQQQQFTIKGVGSGVIVDARNGYVITNEHVVGDFEDLKVRLYDGRDFPGKLVGKDDSSDLALVQIEAKDLVAAELGDSDAIRPGEIVLAFGAPFGYEHTVTQGIISAKGRPGVSDQNFGNMIQTSAAINRGNSGGPLVNLEGKVIGINEAIVGPSGGFAGVGLAIPSNRVRFVYESLAKTGKVVRGFLGVEMAPVDAAAASMLKLESMDGALVHRVTEDSPAAKAGLKPQDVIVAVDGRKVKTSMDLVDLISQTPPGERVTLEVIRDGARKNIVVKLGQRPAELAVVGSRPAPAESNVLKQFGITGVQTVDAQTAKQMGLGEAKGVLITGVQRGSQAESAGLSSGDVILEVNRKPISSPQQLDELAASSLKEHSVIYLSVRNRAGESLVRLSK
ncbi:trypsin-like peptidase domain-containing protein [bacterium]|nr:trypsin-like peptidase domain-containing protein [bacterium]